MSESQSRRVPRSGAVAYLRKADDFARTMELADPASNANGAALAAVHCVISASDAISVHLRGERSAGRDHRDVIQLLSHCEIPERSVVVNQVRQVLDKKNEVEYEGRSIREAEARALCKAAARVLFAAHQLMDAGTRSGRP